MDYLAGLVELIAKAVLGPKWRVGWLLNMLAGVIWIGVALDKQVYGLLLVVVPALFLNALNWWKWYKADARK